MIDFSVAKAAMPAIRIAAKRKVNIVSGTTGFSPAEVEEMKNWLNPTASASSGPLISPSGRL